MGNRRRLLREPLLHIIILGGGVLLLLAFVILRYEGFFAAVRCVLRAVRPLLLGVLFASMLLPSYERLRTDFARFAVRHRRNPDAGWIRGLAAAGAILPPVAVLVSVICVLIPQLSASLKLLAENLTAYGGNLTAFLQRLPHPAWLTEIPQERLEQFFSAVQARLPALLMKTYGYTAAALHWLLDLGIGAVFSLYLLTDRERLGEQLRTLCAHFMRPDRLRKTAHRARLTCLTFARFLRSQIRESLILGVLCWAGMQLLGFPYPVLVSVIIGITNIVPYLGPLIGTVPCALLLLMVKPGAVLWFVLYIVILQQAESNLIYPRIVGSSIGLPPAWVLAAITVGGGLFGGAGMLLGVPLAAVLYALLFPEESDCGISQKTASRFGDNH